MTKINFNACWLVALLLAGFVVGCSKQSEPKAEAPEPAEPAKTAVTQSTSAPASVAPSAASNAPAQANNNQGKKLFRVATLDTIEKNQEFQKNLNLVQRQRQIVVALKAKLDEATDAQAKADLEKQMNAVLAKLNENNQKMLKAYGFTLTRDYTYTIEKSHVYMAVTDAEADQIVSNQ